VRRKDKSGPYAIGFPAQRFSAKNPRSSLNTGTAVMGNSGNSARRNGNNAAGNFQLFAERLYRAGIPPAFFGRPNAVLYMDAVKNKAGLFAQLIAPLIAKLCKPSQHGRGIGASGNSGKVYSGTLFRTCLGISQPG